MFFRTTTRCTLPIVSRGGLGRAQLHTRINMAKVTMATQAFMMGAAGLYFTHKLYRDYVNEDELALLKMKTLNQQLKVLDELIEQGQLILKKFEPKTAQDRRP